MSQSPFLPIVAPDLPRKSTVEKYGSLFYAAIFGLLVCFGLVGVFAIRAWSMRDIWAAVYIVNDPRRPEADRLKAAASLSVDPRVTDRQKWDLATSRTPPPLARYVLAETLTSEAATADPRGYARSVARSDGLPPFLLPLLARPLALAAADGAKLDRESLREVEAHPDPAVALWATYAVAVEGPQDEAQAALGRLAREAAGAGPYHVFAGILQDSARNQPPLRQEILDSATWWLRSHHPDAIKVWAGRRGANLRQDDPPKEMR